MPYANIESRRKYQRDAYQKKKLEYAEQRKPANENSTNELYNSLVKERLEYKFKPNKLYNELVKQQLQENAEYQFKPNEDLKNEITKELKELKNLDIETYNEPYKMNNELDFLTFMSKYKPKNKVFYLAPISSEFLKEFVPDYWNACVKNKFMPLDTFKKFMF